MTLRYKICLFGVKLFEDLGMKVDSAELLSLSIYDYRYCVKEHILVITSEAIEFDFEEIHNSLEWQMSFY